MVSTMTFDQLADTYQRHVTRLGGPAVPPARATLANFLEDAGGDEAIIERRVRIVLVSAGFDTQITTTVMWLNDLYGLDIRRMRLTPYRVAERLLLDVQQVIPLPEAEELMGSPFVGARSGRAEGHRNIRPGLDEVHHQDTIR